MSKQILNNWLNREIKPFPIQPYPDNLVDAAEFLLVKWRENQKDQSIKSLYEAPKLSSLFAVKVFGGMIKGNEWHQWVQLRTGSIIDLTMNVCGGNYHHNKHYWFSEKHIKLLVNLLPCVDPWIDEFSKTHLG